MASWLVGYDTTNSRERLFKSVFLQLVQDEDWPTGCFLVLFWFTTCTTYTPTCAQTSCYSLPLSLSLSLSHFSSTTLASTFSYSLSLSHSHNPPLSLLLILTFHSFCLSLFLSLFMCALTTAAALANSNKVFAMEIYSFE